MTLEELGILFNIKPQELEDDDTIHSSDSFKLYHKDIGFPKRIYIQERFVRLKYSSHALKASLSDRYGEIKLPSSLTIKRDEVIEIETLNNRLNKFVLRRPYNDKHDLIIVLLLKGSLVKTVWLNDKLDLHPTLDETKYSKEF